MLAHVDASPTISNILKKCHFRHWRRQSAIHLNGDIEKLKTITKAARFYLNLILGFQKAGTKDCEISADMTIFFVFRYKNQYCTTSVPQRPKRFYWDTRTEWKTSYNSMIRLLSVDLQLPEICLLKCNILW